MFDIDENGYCRECGINEEKLYLEIKILESDNQRLELQRNVLAELCQAKIGCPRENNVKRPWCDYRQENGIVGCSCAAVPHECWNRWAWQEVK